MKIQLVLTDDWELRGDGSGDMHAIQFDTIRRLTGIYEQFGLKSSFYVEAMQQLCHLRLGCAHPVLLELAYEWEDVIRKTYMRGHDVQMHIHPQWHNAYYGNGQWFLGKKWSITEYPPSDVRKILSECKQYIEELLRPINPDYRCVSFRGAKWCIAPSEYALPILSELGFVFDTSVVPGLVLDLEMAQVDYSKTDESFVPYYPQMHDARRLSYSIQPIVCIPTHSWKRSAGQIFLSVVKRSVGKIIALLMPSFWRTNFLAPSETPRAASVVLPQIFLGRGQVVNVVRTAKDCLQKLVSSLRSPGYRVVDLSALSYIEMRMVLRDIRRQAQASGWSVMPVIIAGHTKSIGDFRAIEKLCAYIAKSPDLEVITLSELARNIQSGVYPIKSAS